MKQLYSLILFFIFFSASLVAQEPFIREKRDHIWLMGYDSNPDDLTFGGTKIDFSVSPPELSYEYRDLDFDITNASICDTAGNLLFYTNGIEVHNAAGELIANGAGLNPDPYTDIWADNGYNLYQGALFLPIPDDSDKFYLLHGERTVFPEELNGNYYIVHKLYLSKILNSEEGGLVTVKNEVVNDDTLDFGKITAVKHGNGRDWWAFQQEYFGNHYYRLLIDPIDVHLVESQIVGERTPSGLGQAVFSPDGNKYIRFTSLNFEEGQFIDIYNFDRCTGLLYDPIQINYNDTAFTGGVAISPNSRFLYVSSFSYVYQYDLESSDIEASKEVVAVYDGVLAPPPFPLATRFFLSQLAPDGKIYISTSNGTRFLHIIHNPNAKGVACNIEQRGLALPTYNKFGIPNSPYYGLGPKDGSPCDTLGLDHHPKAAFRYTYDTTETGKVKFWDYSEFFPTQWLWKFGDDTPHSLFRDTEHTYTQSGIYEVCLTVSNAYASDTHCEWIDITLPTSTQEALQEQALVKIAPNPASEYVTITPLQAFPKGAKWQLSTLQGQRLKTGELPPGQPSLFLDLATLPGGVYVFSLMSKDGRYSGAYRIVVK